MFSTYIIDMPDKDKKKNFYCHHADLRQLIVDAQATGIVSAELAQIGGEIGKRLRQRYRFRGLSFEEAYSIGAFMMITKYSRYDTTRTSENSAFSYFTTVIFNEFRQQYKLMERYDELKRRNTERFIQKQIGNSGERGRRRKQHKPFTE